MLADHTLVMRSVPTDAYRLKSMIYDRLCDIGIAVNPRSFLYCRCPIDGSIIVRTDDGRLSSISRETNTVEQPVVGQAYRFCLRATPMKQADYGKHSAEPEPWIRQQAAKIGIDLDVVHHKTCNTWCGKATGRRPSGFYIPDVVYVGRLIVTDAEKLSVALAQGVGRHRAFGFGLMQLFD